MTDQIVTYVGTGGIFGGVAYGSQIGDRTLLNNRTPLQNALNPDVGLQDLTAAEVRGKYEGLVDTSSKKIYLQSEAFKTRFNMQRYIRNTRNLAETIKDPELAMEKVIAKINRISLDLSKEYADLVVTLINGGFSEPEAIHEADKHVQVSLNNRLRLLEVDMPYAFKYNGFVAQLVKQNSSKLTGLQLMETNPLKI